MEINENKTNLNQGDGYSNEQGYSGDGSNSTEQKFSSSVFKDTEGHVPPEKKKTKLNLVLVIGCIFAAVVVAVVIIMASGETVVDLDEIMTEPTYSGYDTVGIISGGGISEDAFLEKYEDVIEYTDDDDSLYNDVYRAFGMSAASALYEMYISSNVTIDAASGLSNGDTVTYTFDFTETDLEEIEECFDVKLKYSEDGISYTVSGLEEIKSVDVFADIDVTYSGIAPNADISSITNSTYSYVEYDFTPSSGLDNGSVVTISISDSVVEYLAENYGYIPSSTSTEIVAEGLDSYVTSLSEIPAETMEKLKSQSEDVIDSYVASDCKDYVTVEDKTFMGCYFLTPKDMSNLDSSYWDTYIYMIYKLNIHEYVEDELDNTFEYYYFVKYTNPIMLADGTCSIDLSDYDTADGYEDDSNSFNRVIDYSTNSFFSTTTLKYIGYEDLDSLFNNCVTKKVADFNYENTVEE